MGGVFSGNLGFSKTKMGDTGTEKADETLKGLQASVSISGGVSTGVNASNTRIYGSQEQIVNGKDINELKSSYENVMKQLSTSEKNDEITGLARDRSAAIQNVNSLNREKTAAENELKQAEMGFQRMKQSAVTFDENLNDDFVGIAEERYGMTSNAAKELLNSHRPEDQAKRKKLIDATITRQTVRYNFDLPDIAVPDKSSDLNFNKQDLENEYAAKEQITQSKIDDTNEMIAQTKRENQARRAGISDKVDEKIAANKADIAQEKQDIQSKGEAVKRQVKKRSKDGAIWSAGKEIRNAIVGDDDE